MPLDDTNTSGALIPRATIEEIVRYRNRALELYGEAWTVIEGVAVALWRSYQVEA